MISPDVTEELWYCSSEANEYSYVFKIWNLVFWSKVFVVGFKFLFFFVNLFKLVFTHFQTDCWVQNTFFCIFFYLICELLILEKISQKNTLNKYNNTQDYEAKYCKTELWITYLQLLAVTEKVKRAVKEIKLIDTPEKRISF